MHRVEAKLAQWKKLYLQLGEAYERLNAALDRPNDGACIQTLRAEVARLEKESNAALQAVQAQIDAVKTRPPDHSSMWIGELPDHAPTPLNCLATSSSW